MEDSNGHKNPGLLILVMKMWYPSLPKYMMGRLHVLLGSIWWMMDYLRAEAKEDKNCCATPAPK
jgi:hypothetical protein